MGTTTGWNGDGGWLKGQGWWVAEWDWGGGWLKGQGWWVAEGADAPINLLTCILEIHFNYNIFI